MDNNATFSDSDLQGKQSVQAKSKLEYIQPWKSVRYFLTATTIFLFCFLYTCFFYKALEMFLSNVQGVRVNHEALKSTLGESSRNLAGVLSLVKNMDDKPEDQRIFIIEGAAGTTSATVAAAGMTSGKWKMIEQKHAHGGPADLSFHFDIPYWLVIGK